MKICQPESTRLASYCLIQSDVVDMFTCSALAIEEVIKAEVLLDILDMIFSILKSYSHSQDRFHRSKLAALPPGAETKTKNCQASSDPELSSAQSKHDV